MYKSKDCKTIPLFLGLFLLLRLARREQPLAADCKFNHLGGPGGEDSGESVHAAVLRVSGVCDRGHPESDHQLKDEAGAEVFQWAGEEDLQGAD